MAAFLSSGASPATGRKGLLGTVINLAAADSNPEKPKRPAQYPYYSKQLWQICATPLRVYENSCLVLKKSRRLAEGIIVTIVRSNPHGLDDAVAFRKYGIEATSRNEVLIMDEKLHGISNLPVLIIDDIKSARALLSDMLKELGFSQCIEARDGVEAIEKLKATPVQLILCDFLMDGMSGIDFLNELKQHSELQQPPIIFVSAVGDVSSVEAAMKRGATDYLVKPVSFRKFKRKIESTLGLGGVSDFPVYQEVTTRH